LSAPIVAPASNQRPNSHAATIPGANIEQVSMQEPASSETPWHPAIMESSAFSEDDELSIETLVDHVLARNPTLAQMTAAWQAASARYAQATSLDDPMFGTVIGPASIGSNDVEFAYRVEASQKLPFCGKLRLRGEAATAESAAAHSDLDDMRLQLIESAKSAFYDYYLVYRALAVNEESLQLLRDTRRTAEDRFRTGLSLQQDVLQADVEIGRQQQRTLALERMRRVVQARLNTLMHFVPDRPLPRPPSTMELAGTLPDVTVLREQAVGQRPDLRALADRIEADRALLGLAYKEYGPDFEVMAAYDAFWQPEERDLRPMVGVRLNVPIRQQRRNAAVAEMRARLGQRSAELASRTDQVNLQVQEAYERVIESERAVRLFNDTILPAATENVNAARSSYIAARISLMSLIDAQRSLVDLRDGYYETMAEYYRRRATLERVIGSALPPTN
jgi:outer membrane protein TolC